MKGAGKLISGVRQAQKVKILTEAWHQRSPLAGMLRSMFHGKYRASFLTRIALIFAIAYIVSALDLIPDIPVIVWFDDGFVFYLLLRRLLTEADRYKAVSAKTAGPYD